MCKEQTYQDLIPSFYNKCNERENQKIDQRCLIKISQSLCTDRTKNNGGRRRKQAEKFQIFIYASNVL